MKSRSTNLTTEADNLRRLREEADRRTADLIPAIFYEMFGDPVTNPKGWPVTTLKQAGAEIRYGLGQPPQISEVGLPLIRATNIKRGKISPLDLVCVREDDVPASRNAILKAEEVLVVRSGAYTGDIAQVTRLWAGSVAGYDLVITPGDNFTGEFIAAYLLTPFIQEGHFNKLKLRAAQPHLNASQVESTPIMLPSLGIQHQHAQRTIEIYGIQEKQSQSYTRITDLSDSLLNQAFSGKL